MRVLAMTIIVTTPAFVIRLLYWFSIPVNNLQIPAEFWKIAAWQLLRAKQLIRQYRIYKAVIVANGTQVVFSHWNCQPTCIDIINEREVCENNCCTTIAKSNRIILVVSISNDVSNWRESFIWKDKSGICKTFNIVLCAARQRKTNNVTGHLEMKIISVKTCEVLY